MSRNRESAGLRWPSDSLSALEGFPVRQISATMEFFRVVRRGSGPWWFGSSMKGRFDLPEPDGTCYLATDEVTALLEVLGPDLESGAVSSDLLKNRRLRKLHLPRDQSLFDLTSREAIRFGITSEIGTVVPYGCPQAWAARLRAGGSLGVVYWARYDPARKESVALFGLHGERGGWRKGREQAISNKLIERLHRECGIEVVDVPSADQLQIIGD